MDLLLRQAGAPQHPVDGLRLEHEVVPNTTHVHAPEGANPCYETSRSYTATPSVLPTASSVKLTRPAVKDAPAFEQIELDRHREQLNADVRHLFEKYQSIFGWDVPEIDVASSDKLILEEIREVLWAIEKSLPESSAH